MPSEKDAVDGPTYEEHLASIEAMLGAHALDWAATQRQKPSVLQIRSDLLTTAAIGGLVLAAIEQTRGDLAAGALVSIDPTRARARILPLGLSNR